MHLLIGKSSLSGESDSSPKSKTHPVIEGDPGIFGAEPSSKDQGPPEISVVDLSNYSQVTTTIFTFIYKIVAVCVARWIPITQRKVLMLKEGP